MLNTFLTKKVNNCLNKIHISKLKDKTIAVDTSIYLYKFIGENALIEKFFEMCSLFRKYNIKPIFVFDGKPPKEKEEEIKKRDEYKKLAEKEYNELQQKLKEITDNEEENKIRQQMLNLQKSFIRIKNKQIRQVKELLRYYGMTYIDCNGEADQICAYLCKIEKCYACLTEDMDQFIYGTERILRYFSIINESMILYDLNKIYSQLIITKHNFKKMCILSGTDYLNSFNNISTNIFQIYQLIQEYNNNFEKVIEYLEIKYNIQNLNNNINSILNIYANYDSNCQKYKKINIHNGIIDKQKLIGLLTENNFICI